MINNIDDVVVFLGFKVFNSDNSHIFFPLSGNEQVNFVENPQLKKIYFQIVNTDISISIWYLYLFYTCSDKTFKGTVVNQAQQLEMKLHLSLII